MKRRRYSVLIQTLILILFCLSLGSDWTLAKDNKIKSRDAKAIRDRIDKRVTTEQRLKAAAAAAAKRKPGDKAPTPIGVTPSAIVATPVPMPSAGTKPDYLGGVIPNWAFTPVIPKFVDRLPGLTSANANDLGQYIPVATPDTATYPGSDYYEIALVRFKEQMHRDLPATLLQGYVQLSAGGPISLTNPDGSPILLPDGSQAKALAIPHYLGPAIVATKDKPVRIKFRNLLPTGMGGDLFIPVDTTAMGAGMGPYRATPTNVTVVSGNTIQITTAVAHKLKLNERIMLMGFTPAEYNGMFSVVAVPDATNFQVTLTSAPTAVPPTTMGTIMENFTQNRATLHLHGGINPWISDGTPHQWTTPAGEITQYPKGVSAKNVPDMADPGDGSITFIYTNQQCARLMFYHDHAWGITRLNVYAGEAAAYLITDAQEQALISSGLLPDIGIPLVIQDKTFVDASTLPTTDPTWNWGTQPGFAMTGDLWYPHVYMPNQNVNAMDGVNPMGRWDYGPWFWPPWPVENPPLEFADGSLFPPADGMPDQLPNLPDVSMTMEGFMDTPTINGTAYPYIEVEPKAYRFRILNAANDRFWNLQLHVADPAQTSPEPGVGLSEVKMVPFGATQPSGAAWPDGWPVWSAAGSPVGDLRDGGIPDPCMLGPKIIQIGTEGGFLPAPVVWDNIPVGWDRDPKSMTVGNVKEHNLFLGCAERADVIVDFSQFAGQTLILYNDAPAAVPARDPRLDYYTGNQDFTDVGGHAPTLAGYGPNVRTVMQIRVAATRSDGNPITPYDLAALQAAFATNPATNTPGVFAESQNKVLVPQEGYNSAYNGTFPSGGTAYERLQYNSLTFNPLDLSTPAPGDVVATSLTINNTPKAIAEEFESVWGRMSAFLGVEVPFTNGWNQTTIFYGYIDPPVTFIDDNVMGGVPTGSDGTQIWKITHNGVDTHPVHFHLFDVQLINRVDWGGVVKPPELNELGWKETVRMNPLEDCIVALRPIAPKLACGLPDSVRPQNPMMPLGDTSMFTNMNPDGNPTEPPVVNELTNFGWEYVWHCHILSHEEMDMMAPVKFNVARSLPAAPSPLVANVAGGAATLQWTDGTPYDYVTGAPAGTVGNPANEVGFRIERASGNGVFAPFLTVPANTDTYIDTIDPAGWYQYRVVAFNAAGESVSNTASVGSPPTEVIVDNADPGTTSVGTWSLSTSLPAQQWGPNYAWRNASGSFTFPATLVPGATYAVYGWWTAATNRGTAVTYQIRDAGTLLGTATVNQQINGGMWNLLGTYTFSTSGASVSVLSVAGMVSIADAVRFVPIGAPTEVIMDNADPGTTSVGTWSLSTSLPAQRWGPDYAWRNAAGSFTFAPTLVPGTTYQVFGWWTAATNRGTAVPYQIRDGATLLATVNTNQQTNGGMWNLLGTYVFSGTPSVTVVSASGAVSVADAVRFVPVP